MPTTTDNRSLRTTAAKVSLSLLAVAIVAPSLLFSAATPAHAQISVVGGPVVVTDTFANVHKTLADSLVEAAALSVVNSVNYFATQLAYQAAVALTSDCNGQVVCWDSKSFKDGFRQAWQGAIGEAVGTLSTEGGFTALGFNLCHPGVLLALKIQLGLLDELKPPPPKCDFNQLAASWSTFSKTLTSGQALKALKPTFEPGQSPISVQLGALDGMLTIKADAQRTSIMKHLMDAGNGGFGAVTDPVSGRVQAPGDFVKKQFEGAYDAQSKDPQNQAATINAGALAEGAAVQVVSSTIQTFTQTLVARLWNRLANGLLSSEEAIALQPDLILNPDLAFQAIGNSGARQAMSQRVVTIPPPDIGSIDPLVDFVVCPSDHRGPDNCVLDEQFATAVRVAPATPFTVRDAIDKGYLHGDWPLISAGNDKVHDQDPLCFTYGYCESNLKKLRAARVIPIGWEIAASLSSKDNPLKLKDVMTHFDDCATVCTLPSACTSSQGCSCTVLVGNIPVPGCTVASGKTTCGPVFAHMDDQHPFCHLIDPNWVLKAPPAQCRVKAPGAVLTSSDTATRQDQCVDELTCLKQDDNGTCIGGWGYCVAERPVWRFNGDSCPAQYNTCRVLTSRTGETKNLLLNTVDHNVCTANNAGCQQYSTLPDVVSSTSLPSSIPICTDPNGCRYTVIQDSCQVASGKTSCTDPNTGVTCKLSVACAAASGGTCTCNVPGFCRVAKGQNTCQPSLAGDPQDPGDDWLANAADRYFNKNAETCPSTDAGCSALLSLDNGQSLNLIRNGGFEQLEDGDDDGAPDHAKYWTPFGAVPAGTNNGELSTNTAYVGSGSYAMRLPAANQGANALCALTTGACAQENGCPCTMPAGGALPGYSCKVIKGQTACTVTNRVIQTGLTIKPKTTYTISGYFYGTSGNAGHGSMILRFTDANWQDVSLPSGSVTSTMSFVTKDGLPTDYGSKLCGVSSGNLTFMFTTATLNRASGVHASCTFAINAPNIAHATLELISPLNNTHPLGDNIQLEEGYGTPYHDQYGGEGRPVDAKIPPAYLGCTGEVTDRPECASYARVCRENEVGCEAYAPSNGDPTVPGVVGSNDRCPAECVGYDTFKQEASNFDGDKFPVYFIPKTARQCGESDVGCSEFTNLDTEALEYYSRLRLCQKTNDPTTGTFYTWEGSDTTGYQLKVWQMKTTTDANGATAHVAASSNDISVSGGSDAGVAPCTKLDANAQQCASKDIPLSGGSIDGFCTRAAIDAGDLGCREFYDASGNRHYRMLSKTILATDDCHAERITASTAADCAGSSGFWDAVKSQCIYHATPSESNSCSAQVNGCRAYKGNAAANVRNVFTDTFSNGLGAWGTGATLSSEAVTVGDHSISLAPIVASARDLGGLVGPNRSYTLSFWARGSGPFIFQFKHATSSATCTLSTACPASSTGGCSCTTENLTCTVAAGSSSCFIPPATSTLPLSVFQIRASNATDCAASGGSWNSTNSTCRPNLVPEWRQYTLGPVIVTDPLFGTGPETLLASNLGSVNAYVENIVLAEARDSIDVVRDSWKTPASCDMTADGAISPQEMLGCREYTTSAGVKADLRSFTNLCREQAVGCKAYSSTQNTPDNPYEETFNAVCTLTSVCTGNQPCVCAYSGAHYPSGFKNIVDVCRVPVGQSTCRFHLDGPHEGWRRDQEPDAVDVPADKRMFLVATDASMCPATSLGCKAVAAPHNAYQATCTNTNASGNAVACSGSTPCGCQVNDGICFIPNDGKSSTCIVTLNGSPIIDKWNAMTLKDDPTKYDQTLCTEQAVGCDAFTASDGTSYFKDPGDKTCDYKENVYIKNANGVSQGPFSGWFRHGTDANPVACAPEDLKNGAYYDIRKNGDASCTRTTACGSLGGCSCTPPGGASACIVPFGQYGCGYQGWAGTCPAEDDRCEEFVDPTLSSAANPLGTPYYYIDNVKIDKKSCAGSASLKQDCVLFDQTSNPAHTYYSFGTYRKSTAEMNGGAVTPVNCGSSADSAWCGLGAPNDTNVIIKVKPDRECAEWYSCKSFETFFDSQKGRTDQRCQQLELCSQNQQVGSAFKCAKEESVPPILFTKQVYASRSTGWTQGDVLFPGSSGRDFSGYALVGKYPLPFLKPVAIAPGVCFDKNNSPKFDSIGDYISCGASCTTPDYCKPMLGICVGGSRAGQGCDGTTAVSCSLGYCDTNYLATHRFAAVLNPNAACTNDSQCADPLNGEGKCIDQTCYYNFDGGKFDLGNPEPASAPQCRANPESDAPYGESVVDASADRGGYDFYGQAQNRKLDFKGANVCGQGNDCNCSYQRLEYGQGALRRYYSYLNAQAVDRVNKDQPIFIGPPAGICNGGPDDGKPCTPTNPLYTQNSLQQSSQTCAEGGTCQQLTKRTIALGWPGFCVDQDFSTIINGDQNQHNCNLWLPVDQISGALDIDNQNPQAGFVPDQNQLLYCQVAKGLAQTTNNYTIRLSGQADPSGVIPCNSFFKDGPDCERTSGGGSDLGTEADGWISQEGSGQERRHRFIAVNPVPEDQIAGIKVHMNSGTEGMTYNDGFNIYFYLLKQYDWTMDQNFSNSANQPGSGTFYSPEHGHCFNYITASSSDQWDSKNCWGIKARFDASLNLTGFDTVSGNENDVSDPNYALTVDVLLREQCDELAETADISRPVAAIAWTDRLNNGWSNGSKLYELLHKTGWPDPSPDKNPDQHPYGVITVTPVTGTVASTKEFPSDDENGLWDKHLSVFSTEGGSPNMLWGVAITNGQASGYIPNYAKDTTVTPNVVWMRNSSGIPFACTGPCAGFSPKPGNWDSQGTNAELRGISNLGQLFAYAFDTFKWNGNQAYDDPSNAGSGKWDVRSIHLADGTPPLIAAASVENCDQSIQNLCTELPSAQGYVGGITVNDVSGGDIAPLAQGSFEATVKFFAHADTNRMPILRKIIDFGDGTTPVTLWGLYKNHRGCIPGKTCGSGATYCDSHDWGTGNAACQPGYFAQTHSYVCNNATLAALPACGSSGRPYPCKVGNECRFRPRVQVMDNWGTCNGVCPQHDVSSGNTCFNDTTPIDNYGIDSSTSTGPVSTQNNCFTLDTRSYDLPNRPWNEYAGDIIVKAPTP